MSRRPVYADDIEMEPMGQDKDTVWNQIDREGYNYKYVSLPHAILSGWLIAGVALFILIFSAVGYFRFSGGAFFTDFVAAWVFPLLLVGAAATIQIAAHPNSRAWPTVLIVYGIFCLIIAAFEWSSAVYELATEFNAYYSGGNAYYFQGAWIAFVLCTALVGLLIWHVITVVKLLPSDRSRRRPQGGATAAATIVHRI